MIMAKVDRRRRRVVIDALLASQFAGVPRPARPDQITLYEEERVAAYFGGGYLYATAGAAGAVPVTEYENEPIPGLPGLLPPGETHRVAGCARLAGAGAHRVPHPAGRRLFRAARRLGLVDALAGRRARPSAFIGVGGDGAGRGRQRRRCCT